MATSRQTRAAETRRAQREAKPKLHPRCLARSVGRAMGNRDGWRDEVAKLPKTGRKYLYPERHRKPESEENKGTQGRKATEDSITGQAEKGA